jgi:phosphatidate cytidylyltransferase
MNKVLMRVLLLCIFFPFLFFILFIVPALLPHYKYILFNLTTIVFAFFGAGEVTNLVTHKKMPIFNIVPALLGTSLPLVAYLELLKLVPANFLLSWLLIAISLPFFMALFITRQEQIASVLEKSAASLLTIIYPGIFLAYIIFMTAWPDASLKILFFLCLVFVNDIFAYVLGKLFGKKLNLIISPNKSLMGFVGGMLGSVATAFIFYLIFPALFRTGPWTLLLFSVLIGFMTILGDLVESALKRSAGVKDSGSIMMGRGGIMDSIDSLLFSAPLFYYLFPLMLQNLPAPF